MKEVCDRARASGVTLYTKQTDTTAGEPAVLPYCGGGPGRFIIQMQPGQVSNALPQPHLSR